MGEAKYRDVAAPPRGNPPKAVLSFRYVCGPFGENRETRRRVQAELRSRRFGVGTHTQTAIRRARLERKNRSDR